ncbi:MAG: NAD-dependent epimerase/dehydratase family protein [Bacteroides sp.]|nr:NAD-dependent epimerase/dehydratase family protein [Bacteroides sp.]
MKILVTGAAGFIGYHLAKALLAKGAEVVGLDNLNSYYDVTLKYGRLTQLGIEEERIAPSPVKSSLYLAFRFVRMDIADKEALFRLFAEEKFDVICHLAAQAGVRYSLENPEAYIESNITGFIHILEACRHYPVSHLLYASSSSVYGLNTKIPYAESDQTDAPVSLYAATKKADELLCHAYSHLFKIPATGVRFFTVYGPWGRPDMAPFLFMKAILEENPIQVFNNGAMQRDFTYIDDIVAGLEKMIFAAPPAGDPPCRVYNIGHSSPVQLMDFIRTIEEVTGKTAVKNFREMQPGDVLTTYADTTSLEKDYGYKPSVSIREGIRNFYRWYTQENPLR